MSEKGGGKVSGRGGGKSRKGAGGGKTGGVRKNAPGQGRKKTPSAIQRARGNPGRRPLQEEPDFGEVADVIEFPGSAVAGKTGTGQKSGAKDKPKARKPPGKPAKSKAKEVPYPSEMEGDVAAQRFWVIHCPLLAKAQVLQSTDVSILAELSYVWSRIQDAKRQLREDKAESGTFKQDVFDKNNKNTGTRIVRHPSAIQEIALWKLYRSFCSELGLTPSSRAGLFAASDGREDLDAYLDKMAKGS